MRWRKVRPWVFWGIVVLFLCAAGVSVYRYRVQYLISPSTPVLSTTSTAAPLPAISLSSTSTLAEVQQLALQLNKQGKLYLTWERLSDNTYRVLIYRSKKGQATWRLWRTIIVAGFDKVKEIAISAPEVKTLSQYDYFFVTQNQAGENLGVSSVVSFDTSRPGADGTISTVSTGQTIATSTLAQLQNPAPSPAPPAATPAPAPPAAISTAPHVPPAAAPQPPSTPPVPPNYTVYYYTPSGQISSTSTFPAPDQNFWVGRSDSQIQIGWQNLPSGTAKVAVSRAYDTTGPWQNFFSQTNPVVSGPYSVSLVDVGVNASFFYQLTCFAAGGAQIAVFGPVYLSAAPQ